MTVPEFMTRTGRWEDPKAPVGTCELQVPGVSHVFERFGDLLSGMSGHGHHQRARAVDMGGEGERTHDPAGDRVLDRSARAREFGECSVEMFSAADEYDPARLDGRAEPVGAQGLFGEVEALHCVGPIHRPLVLRVDDTAGNDAAVLVGEEKGHPRIGEVRLPLVQDPTCGAQDDAVRVDFPEDLGVRPRDRCGTRPSGASSARSPWRRALAGTAARSRPSAINRSRALRTSSW